MELSSTRRELLLALLGASVGAGCARRAPEVSFEGGFSDGALEDAHRFRDGRVPSEGPVATRTVSVAILGGGVAGLAAAWELRRRGRSDFVVLELEDELGGTARAGRSATTEFPWGAHYVPAPTAENEDLVELLAEAGSVVDRDAQGEPIYAETHLVAAPKERIFFRGTWLEGHFPRAGATTSDLEDLARFSRAVAEVAALRDADGRRAFALPMSASADLPELRALDGRSFAEWLDQRGIASPLVRAYVALGARDDFGTEPSELSAWYGLHYFAARLSGRPALGPRRESSPALEETAEFLTWPEGNAFLVRHLAARIGAARLEPGWVVLRVSPEGDGRRARVLAWNRRRRALEAVVAERVIFALPSFLRSRLLDQELRAPHFEPETVPWMVSNVSLSGRPASFGFGLAWDNVIHASRSLGYVGATHQRHLERGPTVWTHYLALSGPDARAERRTLLGLSYREAADVVLRDLGVAHPDLRAHLERVDIRRLGHAMVRPGPGMATSSARRAAARPAGPVHFAHTDLSGMALFEEAFSHGVRAAREVADAGAGSVASGS